MSLNPSSSLEPSSVSATSSQSSSLDGLPRRGWHEDYAAMLVGGLLVLVSLLVTLSGRPSSDAGNRKVHSKGWPNALSKSIDKPQAWNSNPIDGLTNVKSKKNVGWPIVFGMGWVVLIGSMGSILMGRSVLRFLPGGVFLVLLTCIAYFLSAQKVVESYNLEYPLWALMVGLIIGNTVGELSWLKPALIGEFFIKTGLVIFGAEVLFSRLLELGLPGLMTAWIVTPIVLISTYLFGVYVLRIPSRSLCMTVSADMSVCGVSAAIATAGACKAKKEELSLAIGLSLFFTVIMMVVMPPFIKWIELDDVVGGAWIGGTIDATGAVVAAGESLGKEAGEVAATVKMIQNSMIGLIAFGVAVYWAGWVEKSEKKVEVSLGYEVWRRFPKFIIGFFLASVLCSILFTLSGEASLLVDGSNKSFIGPLRGWLFCIGFICMGIQTNFRQLAPMLVSGRPVIMYVLGQALNLILTLTVASLTFGWLFKK
jgi:uncharacterized integral membrane protein (TIGR00698 family)